MRNLKLWKAAIGILVLAALCVCLLPWPSRIDMAVPSQKVTEDGTVVEDGQIVLKGWKLDYLLRRDRYKFTELKIHGFEPDCSRLGTVPAHTAFGGRQGDQKPYQYTDFIGYLSKDTIEGSYYLKLCFNLESGWCHAKLDFDPSLSSLNSDGCFFGYAEETDIEQIMEYFHVYVD